MHNKPNRLDILESLPGDLQIEIVENMFRKDLTESEKAEIQNILKTHLSKHTQQGKRNDLTLGKNMPEVDGRVNNQISEMLGESKENVRKRDIVYKAIDEGVIDEETKQELDAGSKSLHSAYKDAMEIQNKNTKIPRLPKGKYNHIVQDPGWEFKNKSIGGSGTSGSAHQYTVQATLKIARIPVHKIAADDAIMYMWTTNQHLVTGSMLMSDFLHLAYNIEAEVDVPVQSDALAVMQCQGFEPKHIITWYKQNKNGWGGYSFNNVTEHLIIGTRGKVKPFGLTEKTMVSSVWKKSHSEKPEEAWQLIEKIVKTQRWQHQKLEMNARKPRPGWTPHGNQI